MLLTRVDCVEGGSSYQGSVRWAGLQRGADSKTCIFLMTDSCTEGLYTYAYECMNMNRFLYSSHLRTYGVPKKPSGNVSNNTHHSNQIKNPQEMTPIILSGRSTLAPATIAIVKTLYEETL